MKKCKYCGKVIVKEMFKNEVHGASLKIFDDGSIGCAGCMCEIYSGN